MRHWELYDSMKRDSLSDLAKPLSTFSTGIVIFEASMCCDCLNQERANENTSLVLVQWDPFHWWFIFPSFLIRKLELLTARFGHLMRFLNLFLSLMEKMFAVHWQGLSFCGPTYVETSRTSQFYFMIPHSNNRKQLVSGEPLVLNVSLALSQIEQKSYIFHDYESISEPNKMWELVFNV